MLSLSTPPKSRIEIRVVEQMFEDDGGVLSRQVLTTVVLVTCLTSQCNANGYVFRHSYLRYRSRCRKRSSRGPPQRSPNSPHEILIDKLIARHRLWVGSQPQVERCQTILAMVFFGGWLGGWLGV